MVAFRLFISHAATDSAFAERLASDLRRARADVQFDDIHLSGPGDFTVHINQTLGDRDVLLVLSSAAIASQWASAELNASIVRVNQGLMRPPLIVQGAPVPLAEIAGIWTLY
jgi:TIR domain-containing protein